MELALDVARLETQPYPPFFSQTEKVFQGA